MNTGRPVSPALLLVPLILIVIIVAVMVLGPLVVAAYLLACFVGGVLLSHWPVVFLRYAAIPPAVMGVTTALLPPYACGYDPHFYDAALLALLFVGAAKTVYDAKTYDSRVHVFLGLLCGVAVGLHLQVGLCHADYTGEFNFLERWFRGGVWLAVLGAMATGSLSAWFGIQANRLLPSARK